jgi:glycerate 2-kinase
VVLNNSRAILTDIFMAAVAAVHPTHCVADHLPPPPKGRTVVVGAGKAAAAMAAAIETAWPGPLEGLVVTRYRHTAPTQAITVLEAGHPFPDESGQEAARRILAVAGGLGPDDLLLSLVSGGGSALLALPAPGISLADKQQITAALFRAGAPISVLNTIRGRLSAIKAGRLAKAALPARVFSLVISDIPGDDPRLIASGPTLPVDGSADVFELLRQYGVTPTGAVARALAADESRPPVFSPAERERIGWAMCARPQDAFAAAAEKARTAGLSVVYLGERIEGEAQIVGQVHAGIAQAIQAGCGPVSAPALILSGGETTVNLQEHHKATTGRGGRNVEFLMGLTAALAGQPGIYALAADTDGIDGSEDNAGAFTAPDTIARGHAAGLFLANHMKNHDGYSYFAALGDLVTTGPTCTNVNDFRAVLVLPT